MIQAADFMHQARERGFRLFTGVPCSYLKPFINYVLDAPGLDYVGAANEGDAVAIAAGADLAGRRSVVLFQNSGLGHAVNPLTSLNAPFRIPALLIVTWRGEPGGDPDEPQHELMGQITPRMLDRCQVVALGASELGTPRDEGGDRLGEIRPVTSSGYLDWVKPARSDGSARDLLLEVNQALRPARLGLGFRQFDRVLRYVESSRPFVREDVALDYQFKQVVLPQLRRTAPRFAVTVQALARLMPRERFPRSAEMLSRILEARDDEDYFQLL